MWGVIIRVDSISTYIHGYSFILTDISTDIGTMQERSFCEYPWPCILSKQQLNGYPRGHNIHIHSITMDISNSYSYGINHCWGAQSLEGCDSIPLVPASSFRCPIEGEKQAGLKAKITNKMTHLSLKVSSTFSLNQPPQGCQPWWWHSSWACE